MNQTLRNKLRTLPSSPGVYFHKNAIDEIIYVGKAAVLRNRVKQYFQSKKDMDSKTIALVNEITDVDWMITESEIDALFLESEMIKRYKPRYNILLRDDKSQIFVRINMRDEVPYVSFTRQPINDGAEYFGPFYNGATIKRACRFLRKIFPYYIKQQKKTSRLEYQIGLTPDIENGKMTLIEYKKSLRQFISYIKGNRVAVMREIEKSMKLAADKQDFEKASYYRNQIFNLMGLKKQVVFSRDEFLDVSRDQGLTGLRDMLQLRNIPRRIESYDVSHHGGKDNVASMVVFTNGMPDKTQYRKFKLHLSGNDDCAHMRETVERRRRHLLDWGRPDLVIIDGSVGQLSTVADLLNAESIPFIGRNKSGVHARNAKVNIIVPYEEGYKSIDLGNNSHEAKLIARLDDEAHRFAVSYHTLLKRTRQTKSDLEQISGIGPVTRKKLIKKFGSQIGVRKASFQEIADVIGESKANLVYLSK